MLINKHECVGHYSDSKAFIEYSNDVFENLKNERKIFILFDDMTADMVSNKKHQKILTELSYKMNILQVEKYYLGIKNKR